MAKATMTTLQQIADAQSQAEELEDAYLRERGWQHTCDTPGSLWVWSKTLPDGRVILTSKTQALAFASVMERGYSDASDEEVREWDRELKDGVVPSQRAMPKRA